MVTAYYDRPSVAETHAAPDWPWWTIVAAFIGGAMAWLAAAVGFHVAHDARWVIACVGYTSTALEIKLMVIRRAQTGRSR